MYIEVEVTEDIFFDEMKRQKKLIEEIESQFRRDFSVSASIKPVERGSLAKEKKKIVEDTR
jgi:phenylacetate-CoA ligase